MTRPKQRVSQPAFPPSFVRRHAPSPSDQFTASSALHCFTTCPALLIWVTIPDSLISISLPPVRSAPAGLLPPPLFFRPSAVRAERAFRLPAPVADLLPAPAAPRVLGPSALPDGTCGGNSRPTLSPVFRRQQQGPCRILRRSTPCSIFRVHDGIGILCRLLHPSAPQSLSTSS